MEIEIKARITNLNSIRRKLLSRGARREKKVHQIDMFFSLFKRPLNKMKGSIVRVRHNVEEKRTTLEYDTAFNAFAAEEVEVTVNSLPTVLRLLKKMKAKLEIVVDKQREYFRQGQFETVLDTVKGLGTFIEVEIDGANTKANRQLVVNYLQQLGVERSQFVLGPKYFSMLLWKKGKKYAYF